MVNDDMLTGCMLAWPFPKPACVILVINTIEMPVPRECLECFSI